MNKEKKKRFPIGICLLICVFLLAGVILTLALIGAGKREKKKPLLNRRQQKYHRSRNNIILTF